ncbi:CyP450 monooxygenase [Cubamyces menziesii]|nr:CyP450 monooxygenase [Cubamyces menziesii]
MTDLSPHSLALLILGIISVLAIRYAQSVLAWKARSRGRPLPPGPKPLPIVGNVFSAPKTAPWAAYRDMCARYGDILSLQMLGQRVMIIGSAKVAFELLEKRSANYSDRPVSPMIDLIGWEWDFGFMPYGQTWRRHRRLFWQHFHPGVVSKYHTIQREASCRFLQKLLASPARLEDHIRYTFASSVLKAVYGIEVAERGDKIVDTVELAMEGVALGLTPGAFLVEYLPFLRYVPEWLPGAGFQKRLRRWRDASHTMVDLPFEEAKMAMTRSDPMASVVGTILSTAPASGPDEELTKNVAAIAYAGKLLSTISTFQTFFLAMSLHPDAQARARAELLSVVGPERLPDMADRDALPSIDAIIKECLRWQNATPLGLPHAVVEDDEYDGYFIPAGTVTFPNAWAILHDPDDYPEPDKFLPERFIKDGRLNPDVRDPATVAFGFGRRICPGRYFADAALFLNIARVLHVFEIGPPRDDAGQPIRIEPKMKDGFLSYPEDCRCTIKPLSSRAETLIQAANEKGFEEED